MVPLSQIVSLIELSEFCEQSFQYDCTYSPFQNEGIDFAYWEDRHGLQNNYYTGLMHLSVNQLITSFAGSNYGNHVCDCFYDSEGCIESETLMNRCNCDSTLPIPLTDTGTKKDVFCLQTNILKGIITNTTALPVTKLYFGGLIYDVQSGAFLLGRLKCYGKNKVLALQAFAGFICLQS